MKNAAFTLIEILVVIAIISILIAILLPTLSNARQSSRAIQCKSNLKQVGVLIASYQTDSNGRFFDHRNWGRWLIDPSIKTQLIDPSHPDAFWGVAYAKHGKAGREIFNCPDAQDSDPSRADGTFAQGHIYITYGFNGWGRYESAPRLQTLFKGEQIALFRRVGATSRWEGRRIDEVVSPAETVLVHDAYEPMLDGNGDTLDNLFQWSDRESEYLRHNNSANALWADGHVSTELKNDWTRNWYMGKQ